MTDWSVCGPLPYIVGGRLVDFNEDDSSQTMAKDYDDGNFYVQGGALDCFKIYTLDQDELSRKPPEVIRY